MAFADSGGGITVAPASLTHAASAVRSASGHAEEAGASGGLNACVTTGYPTLDGALNGFDARWTSNVSRSGNAGEQLAGALTAASTAYLQTDAGAMP